ncbi:MAG TPA: hypothetical protein VGA01_20765 [Candidatus Binatia bacterium]
MEAEIKFPLSHPTHYIACLNNFDVTHVAVKLCRQTLLTLLLLLYAPQVLAFFNIVRLAFARRRQPGQMSLLDNLSFYRYTGKERIQPGVDMEFSTDEDPYNCLSLGELASLGGFTDEEVLKRKFELIPQSDHDLVGVTVYKAHTGMVFFKVLFCCEEYETDMFNVRLLVQKYFDQVHETSVKNVKEARRRLSEKWKEHDGKK